MNKLLNEACGMFNSRHLFLVLITLMGVTIAVKNTAKSSKEQVFKIIKNCTFFVIILEIIMIMYKINRSGLKNVNNYVPLYFCSLLIYSGILTSFAKGKLQRMGQVFLATGGLVGGLVFIIFPTTSLPSFPMIHFVSLHSFTFHGIMIYLGILLNITHFIELQHKDVSYHALLIGFMCILALTVNNLFDGNLMFISKNFPGMPIEILYNISGKLFTPIMCVIQMFLPFYMVYGFQKLKEKVTRKSLQF